MPQPKNFGFGPDGVNQLAELAALVRQPDSVGRYRQFDWRSEFTEEQLARLARLGYTA